VDTDQHLALSMPLFDGFLDLLDDRRLKAELLAQLAFEKQHRLRQQDPFFQQQILAAEFVGDVLDGTEVPLADWFAQADAAVLDLLDGGQTQISEHFAKGGEKRAWHVAWSTQQTRQAPNGCVLPDFVAQPAAVQCGHDWDARTRCHGCCSEAWSRFFWWEVGEILLNTIFY